MNNSRTFVMMMMIVGVVMRGVMRLVVCAGVGVGGGVGVVRFAFVVFAVVCWRVFVKFVAVMFFGASTYPPNLVVLGMWQVMEVLELFEPEVEVISMKSWTQLIMM